MKRHSLLHIIEVIRTQVQKESMSEIDKKLENNGIENKINNSEYETYDTDSDGEEIKENVGNEDDDEHNFESEDSVILEREEGDGQESISVKKVDDDEDKKNPQYIPKRGTFYEHDDRTLEDSEETQELPEKPDKQNKKNVWMEKKERWGHDRYNDNEQAPKTRSELVAIYGYDIRNEDGPPKARRRRRYGRGPNKYTRTWEDEDAYKPTKPLKVAKPKSKRREDFQTDSLEENDKEQEEPVACEVNHSEEEKNQHPSPPPLVENKVPTNVTPKQRQDPPRSNQTRSNNYSTDYTNHRIQNHRIGSGRTLKSKPELKNEIKDSITKVLPKNYKMENVPKLSNSKEDGTEDVQKDLSQMSIQEEFSKSNRQNNQRQNSVPPRLQAEQKASKRYKFNQPTQASLLQQTNTIHASTPVPQIAPPPLSTIPQQVTGNPILQAPPQFAAPFPQPPPPFLPPAVPTASFITQQAPPIINYVQGQGQFPAAPPPYQVLQHQQFSAVNQPAELYQCQGGTTYYSTQNQHISHRSVPQKRPKAAIPIVPPPPQEPRGRGRSNNTRDHSLPGEDLCETLITDNSNLYEDSIVYVQQ
ncbi:hypothetical protein FQR65_LT10308 [Abscondita terminalis]|nr:hypothetical protein FQR65_LT10308 [Abscondita terminalis]